MPTDAPYDVEIADGCEHELLAVHRSSPDSGYADAIGIDKACGELLGQGARARPGSIVTYGSDAQHA